MNGCAECLNLSRRRFLQKAGAGVGAMALADPLLRSVVESYAATPRGTGNLLVLCQLNGGLDVLSFLAPFTNPVYQAKRPTLALREADVVPLPDHSDVGINRQFQFFADLYTQGQLAIVQQTAYPQGNGSHFESQEIYEFGVRNLASREGTRATWYERLRAMYFNEPFGVLNTQSIGDPARYGYPDPTFRRAAQDAFGRLARLQRARTPAEQAVANKYDSVDRMGADIRSRTATFQSTGTARGEFFRAAQLASAGLGTQVLRLSYGGFDTHASQAAANVNLFPRLNNEFRQFVDDAKALGIWDRTCVVFYTEFGRRNEENGSPGTDHGHGCHMILAGPRVRSGLHGQMVTTADLQRGSLPYYVDFRAVFGACIRDWLGFDPRPVFALEGETFDENVGSSLFV